MWKKLFWCVLAASSIAASAVEIALPEKASEAERRAGALLRKELPADTVLRSGGREIAVIRLTRSDSMRPEEYGAEQNGDAITLSGGDARGVFYAVCAFLERSLGVRVWNPVEQSRPAASPERTIEPPRWRVRPAFAMRDLYNDYFVRSDGGFFAAFNRVNLYGDMPISAEFGGSARFGKPYSVHTFAHYFPEKDYFAAHPEYFALIGGKRKAGPQSQLCLSNPEVERLMIAKLKAFIEADEKEAAARNLPPPRYYDISANDNNSICSCDPCKRIIAEEGEQSGLILRFVNRIAAAAEAFRPGLQITTLAYMNTEVPPKHERPRGNVVIRLCNTSINNFAGILSPENRVFREKVERWNKTGAQLYLWEYAIFYLMPDLPYPREFDYPELFRYYRDNNVRCMFMEHEQPDRADMHTFKSYLEAKLMENPDADFEALRTDFLTGYYGKAAPMIDAYRKLLRKSALEKRSFGFNYITSTGSFDFLDAATVTAASRLLNQAETAVADAPVELERVRRVRLNLDKAIYVLCRRWSAENGTLPPELDRDAALRRARTSWSAAIDKFYPEEKRDRKRAVMEQELKRFAALPASTVKPDAFASEPRRIDYLPELINIHHHKLVLDPASATGYAVRAESPVTRALHAGGYVVPENRHQFGALIPPEKVKAPGYHWYKVAEFTPEPGGYLYLLKDWTIQIPQDAAASRMNPGEKWELHARVKFEGLGLTAGKDAIMVDRVVLVPKR